MEESCIICLLTTKKNLEKNTKCPCVYSYHRKCMDRWEGGNKCPMCRRRSRSSSISLKNDCILVYDCYMKESHILMILLLVVFVVFGLLLLC
jgi:hypothetical protein